jgi:hypothetical protein
MKIKVLEKELAKISSLVKILMWRKYYYLIPGFEEIELAQDIDIAVKGVKPEKFRPVRLG